MRVSMQGERCMGSKFLKLPHLEDTQGIDVIEFKWLICNFRRRGTFRVRLLQIRKPFMYNAILSRQNF
jgi:hypothetical protein